MLINSSSACNPCHTWSLFGFLRSAYVLLGNYIVFTRVLGVQFSVPLCSYFVCFSNLVLLCLFRYIGKGRPPLGDCLFRHTGEGRLTFCDGSAKCLTRLKKRSRSSAARMGSRHSLLQSNAIMKRCYHQSNSNITYGDLECCLQALGNQALPPRARGLAVIVIPHSDDCGP